MLDRSRTPPPGAETTLAELRKALTSTRSLSVALAAPLSAEDMTVQATPDASPTKWHLGHTTWFFETFILQNYVKNYQLFDDQFNFCFNSYYESFGARQPRSSRGVLSRPSSDRVFAYRAHIDAKLDDLLANIGPESSSIAELVTLGINHEQQHQELLLTDILSLFAANPLRPAYQPRLDAPHHPASADLRFVDFAGGIFDIGAARDTFSWDNETPRHQALVHDFQLADRLVTNREWLEFMADGGYRTPALWLSDGWTLVNAEGWIAPLYWEQCQGEWYAMSLDGLHPIELDAPVCHVSYFEADAFTRWAGKRLPTEFEWEIASAATPSSGNTVGSKYLRPMACSKDAHAGLQQMFGDCWQWTQSAYLPYPGYRSPPGALGEYNGKFMVSQHVLRGASCVTPARHSRATYRNFFYPHQRWQFTGLRLARDL
ncbi:MAG: ergothioneine biosynthesis protein EgtB [Hyphomicrobium sp.]|nr:ergothioneine biosynthesis protein EgtB [Hyphomicrobium sp.]